MEGGGGGGVEWRQEAIALLVIVVLAALAIASLLFAFSYYCYIRSKVSKRRKSLNSKGQPPKNQDLELGPQQPPPAPPTNSGKMEAAATAATSEKGIQVFSYNQLHSATGGFGKGNVVGHGSFGSVYKGVLGDGRKVAVKLMDRPGKQGEEEFDMEVLGY